MTHLKQMQEGKLQVRMILGGLNIRKLYFLTDLISSALLSVAVVEDLKRQSERFKLCN